MAKDTKITWANNTFNPWIGCAKVATGCANCYAEREMEHHWKKVIWGPDGTRKRTSKKYWGQLARWNAEAAAAGTRPRIFCASLADVFEEFDGPIMTTEGKQDIILGKDGRASSNSPSNPRMTMDDCRLDLFEQIDRCENLDFLLLTKRPENVLRMWPAYRGERTIGHIGPPRRQNVWLGVSVAEQKDYDKNWPILDALRDLARFVWISAEPLVGPIKCNFKSPRVRCNFCGFVHGKFDAPNCINCKRRIYDVGLHELINDVDWMVVGGESGDKARPMKPEWATDLLSECRNAGIAYFFKQFGEWVSEWHPASLADNKRAEPNEAFVKLIRDNDGRIVDYEGQYMFRVGNKAAGDLLDGKQYHEFPSGANQ